MNIGIIGAGKMGNALSQSFGSAGHQIQICDRNQSKANQVASKNRNVQSVPISEVSGGADIVIAATYWQDSANALHAAGDLSGKIVVDICNPVTSDGLGLTVGHTTSFAEELSKEFPKAHLIKAFNTVFAQVWNQGPDYGQAQTASALFCGDDLNAKQTIQNLIDSTGFIPVDCGPLQNARLLEPMGLLVIYLGFNAGLGTQLNFTAVNREAQAGAQAA